MPQARFDHSRTSEIPLSPALAPPFERYHSTPTSASVRALATHFDHGENVDRQDHGQFQTQELTPYLGLTSRLSLTLLTLPLLSLLLSLFHLVSSSNVAKDQAEDAKAQILATCHGVEQGAAYLQQLPALAAEKLNEEITRGVQATLLGLAVVLEDSLTIIETVLNFVIDMYRSLLMCTIELVVRGTLAIMIGAVSLITNSITSSLNSVRTSIQSDIASANSAIQSAVSAINSVTSLVKVTLSVPQFSIPSLSGLENVQIPTTFEDSLVKLNSSLPSLSELKDIIADIIDVPFKSLRDDLNASFTGLAGNFSSTLLPVPGNGTSNSLTARVSQSSIDLCSGMDVSFVDDIAADLQHLANVGIGLLILAFFILWLALIGWEWFTYRCIKAQAERLEVRTREDRAAGQPIDGMLVIQIVEHPVIEKYAPGMLKRLSRDRRTQTNIRWFFAFITHHTALAVLFFGIITFAATQAQIGAVQSLRKRSINTSQSAITASSTELVQRLNAAALGQSNAYAAGVNARLMEWQNTIDTTVFGPWLKTTTVVLNSTLVTFYDDLEKVLNSTFGGTILDAPVQTFVYCILGSKIDNLEEGLTWIHDNAKVTLPTIPADALMLSNGTMNKLITPVVQAAAGGGSNGDDGVIGTIFDRYIRQLRMERLIAGLFIAAWGLVVMAGLAVLLWHSRLGGRLMHRRLAHIGPAAPDAGLGEKTVTHASDEKEPEQHHWQPGNAYSDVAAHRRPSMSHATSGWSNRVRSAVNSMLKVPGETVRHSFLNRKGSQKSERSWLAPASSPWSEKQTAESDIGANTRASSPVKFLPPTQKWTKAYPLSQDSRYPPLSLKHIPTPIAVKGPGGDTMLSDDEYEDDGETTPLTASYRPQPSRQPIQQEYFDTLRHPRQYGRSPFATPFDDPDERR